MSVPLVWHIRLAHTSYNERDWSAKVKATNGKTWTRKLVSRDCWQARLPLRASRRLKNGFRIGNLGLPDILKLL